MTAEADLVLNSSKGIYGFAKSVFNVILCTPILTYDTSKVCEAFYAFQNFERDRESCILGGVDTHHFCFRYIDF